MTSSMSWQETAVNNAAQAVGAMLGGREAFQGLRQPVDGLGSLPGAQALAQVIDQRRQQISAQIGALDANFQATKTSLQQAAGGFVAADEDNTSAVSRAGNVPNVRSTDDGSQSG